ncbi:hypothetical protein KBY70_02390 [Cyanobium sp. ATX 6E8]|uniref:hypothetical protein n=1 Tax=Cyanobium sp. ATX 6E8 TaxID=2823701 RepID=UPI0020CBB68B|nr:hypothetical protein [Cyanobium sp. ATX 6E8]MCP9941251.1 hypothetical protein [Cyanobium sp. ATX 6E8]
MAELLEALTLRQRVLVETWSAELQAAQGWCGSLPVALLERCWLRLQRVPVEQLATVLPPDASGEAPKLVRYRAWIAAGQPAWSAQVRCWQEFGQPACQDALRRFWNHQDRGNHGWTLQSYLQFLETYRRQCEPGVTRALPLIVLARGGQREAHSLHWLAPLGQPMRHTCA